MSDEIWVDTSRGSAISRQIRWTNKRNPQFRFDVEHKQREGGWLPNKWVVAYSGHGSVWQVEKLEVESLELNPSLNEGEFTIPVTPGMIVVEHKYPPRGAGLDPTRPARKLSRVRESGREETIEERGFTTIDGKELPPERLGLGYWWFAIAGLLLGLVYLGFRFVKHRRPVVPDADAQPGG
jgi:hypothetical protein